MELGIKEFEEISPPTRPYRTIKFSKSPPHTASTVPKSPKGSGGIFENTAVIKKVDEQYMRHKREKAAMDMQKRESYRSFNGQKPPPSKKNDDKCVIY